MADLAENASPTDLDDSQSVHNGNAAVAAQPHAQPASAADQNRGVKRARTQAADDDDDDDNGRERRKIEIKFINDKSRRHITFSKRKAGIMKKAYELSVLTGTQVLLLVVSETGLVYTFTTPKLQPLVTKPEGKNLIQACLNAPEPANAPDNSAEEPGVVESPDGTESAHIPQQPQPPRMPQNHMNPQAAAYMPPGVPMDPAQALYGNYVSRPTAPQYMPQQHPNHQA